MADLTRHSTRNFSDKQVDSVLLKQIVQEAQKAPSWENSQPYHVFIASGETAKRIHAAHQEKVAAGQKSWTEVVPPKEWTKNASDNIADWQKRAGESKQSDEFGELNGQLFNAPAIVYITIKKDASSYVAYDAGALGYGILLAAKEHGLGTIPAYAFVRYPEEIHQEFSIPDDESIFMGIGVGYPDADPINDFQVPRDKTDDILTIKD